MVATSLWAAGLWAADMAAAKAGYAPGGYVQGGYPGGDPGFPSWGWNPQVDVTSWGPPQIYPLGGGGTDHITVDCRDPGGPRLNSALSQLAPGGTLYLRGRGPGLRGKPADPTAGDHRR